MKKPAKRPANKARHRPFLLDKFFTHYRKYRNYIRYVHSDLL